MSNVAEAVKAMTGWPVSKINPTIPRHNPLINRGNLEDCAEELVTSPVFDPVLKVKHYQVFPEKDLEAIDIIERVLQLSSLEKEESYYLGNALKYVLRLGRKDNVKQDAGKAIQYLKRLRDGGW